MCKNAASTASNLLLAIEPTVKQLLTLEGIENTPQAEAGLAAFAAAQQALANWKSGTKSEQIVELINDFGTAFALLPIPPADEALLQLIQAGLVSVIAVIEANSPPSTTALTGGTAVPPIATSAVTFHTAKVVHAASMRVAALVPDFHPSIMEEVFHERTAAADEYTKQWAKTLAASRFAKEAA